MEKRDIDVAHVIACARALVYGSSGEYNILRDALETAVSGLDVADIERMRQLSAGGSPPLGAPVLAVHSCDAHARLLGVMSRWGCRACQMHWCTECGAFRGNDINVWNYPANVREE